jgi:hypothetical protein
MNHHNTIARPTAAGLRSTIAGEAFFPGDAGYDDARRAWNLQADLHPAAVVIAESAADTAMAVRFARSHGMRIAPQGTGHGATALQSLDDVMLLKTTRMRRVDVFPASRQARVEAGAEWSDVTVPAAQCGLAALAGSSPNVGVTGYTLGGGLGWLARRVPGAVAVRRVAAPRRATPGRPSTTARRPRTVRSDGRTRLRRARHAGAPSDRRTRTPPEPGDRRRAHTARATHRAAGRRRGDLQGSCGRAVRQSAHRRCPPAEHLSQARHHVAAPTAWHAGRSREPAPRRSARQVVQQRVLPIPGPPRRTEPTCARRSQQGPVCVPSGSTTPATRSGSEGQLTR